MTTSGKKTAFVTLGKFLSQFTAAKPIKDPDVPYNNEFFDGFISLIESSQNHNGWHTPDQVRFAVTSWAEALTNENLDKWLSAYKIPEHEPKTVGLILAGNIPLVGFHDFLSVVMSGHRALVKMSSNDRLLLTYIAKYLETVEPEISQYFSFTDEKLTDFDAVIATGSNNTSRYFEYYFRDKPSIIRKNRNSVAILTGDETQQELISLGKDIFTYFGLGCRNVSKLFVPSGYDFTNFFEAMYTFRDVVEYKKYANNYDYNKAVFLMSSFKILDNGFMTLKEDPGYASPISSVFYEFYDDLDVLQSRLKRDSDQIQCIVGSGMTSATVGFGMTQKPELWDYADNVDTMAFLLSI